MSVPRISAGCMKGVLILLLAQTPSALICRRPYGYKMCRQLCATLKHAASFSFTPKDLTCFVKSETVDDFREKVTPNSTCEEVSRAALFENITHPVSCNWHEEHAWRLLLQVCKSGYDIGAFLYSPLYNAAWYYKGTAFRKTLAIGFIPSLNVILISTEVKPFTVHSVGYLSHVKTIWMKGLVPAISVDTGRRCVFYSSLQDGRAKVFSVTFEAEDRRLIYRIKSYNYPKRLSLLSGENMLYICTSNSLVTVTHEGKNESLIERGHVTAVALDQRRNVLYFNRGKQLVRVELETQDRTTYNMKQIYDLMMFRGILYISYLYKVAAFDNGTSTELTVFLPNGRANDFKFFLLCNLSTE